MAIKQLHKKVHNQHLSRCQQGADRPMAFRLSPPRSSRWCLKLKAMASTSTQGLSPK